MRTANRRDAVPLALAVLASLGLATACSDSHDGETTGPSGEEDAIGAFSASATGDLERSLEGEATWGATTNPATGDEAWILILSADGTNFIWVTHLGDSQPQTQTYSMFDVTADETPDTGTGASISLSAANGSAAFSGGSTAGSVQITSTSGDNVSGTFSITAFGTVVTDGTPQEGDVTITGEFNAIGVSDIGFRGF